MIVGTKGSFVDRLLQIVDAATPGPWESRRYGFNKRMSGVHSEGHGCLFVAGDAEGSHADAVFVGAFDPLRVSRMLDVVDAANAVGVAHVKRDRKELRSAVRELDASLAALAALEEDEQ